MSYVRYTPDIEVKQPHEDEQIEQIVALMAAANKRAFDQHRHAIRDAHAKQHGTVVGELHIYPNLPEHLAQGILQSLRFIQWSFASPVRLDSLGMTK